MTFVFSLLLVAVLITKIRRSLRMLNLQDVDSNAEAAGMSCCRDK